MPAFAPDCPGILIIKYLTTIHKDIPFLQSLGIKEI
jgi:hypothetical protein